MKYLLYDRQKCSTIFMIGSYFIVEDYDENCGGKLQNTGK